MKQTPRSLLLGSLLALALLPGCVQTRAEIAREKEEKELRNSLQQSVMESQRQVEALQSEVGRLQGKLEEMDHTRAGEMTKLNSNWSTGRESTEKQVADLRKALEEQQKTQAAAQQALFEEVKRLKEENAQLADSVTKRPAQSGAQKKSAKGDYDAALAAYQKKQHAEAAEGFRAYLQAMPNGKFAIASRYYLADSLYRQKSYNDAIVEFGAVHEKSAASVWGRKSTLRLAQSFAALGKPKEAKAFAEILVSSAPGSDEAKKAKALLK